jgi:UPF0755 protein
MAMQFSKIKVALFVGLSIAFITLTAYFYQVFFSPNVMLTGGDGLLFIPKNATVKHLQDSLKRYGMVDQMVPFMFVARLLGYTQNIKPGAYLLESRMNNLNAVRLLRSGKQVALNLTFNNVRTKHELCVKLTRDLPFQAAELHELLNNPAFIDSLGLGMDTATIVSLFLPNTYQVYWTISPKELVWRFKREYDAFWNENRKKRADEIGLSPVQVSVLASIVDAETNKKDEKRRIAGVYLNRLNKGIVLAADPTLVFAHGDFNIKRVLNIHKTIDSPYNTYKYSGLPPGPIRIPEAQTIDAVLDYEKHNFLYFCAREDLSGYHNFASTLAEHSRNSSKYHKALNEQKIYR